MRIRLHPAASIALLGMGLTLASPRSLAVRDDAFVPDAEPPAPAGIREPTPWQESEVALPAWPADADLVELVPDGPGSSLRYWVDSRSLRVGGDGVVRYTLVAEGGGGARNLAVEGIRCTPKGSYKTYAYATAGAAGPPGTFEPIEGAAWQPISRAPSEGWRYDLWKHHLCVPHGFKPRPEKEMVRSLRGSAAPHRDMGLQAD